MAKSSGFKTFQGATIVGSTKTGNMMPIKKGPSQKNKKKR